MATIHIDNQAYEVDEEQNLLSACLSLGLKLPYFCWHPALGSVGACRQCAVMQYEDENDSEGKLVMACMTPAADGTRISLDASQAVSFRANVVEWLMQNHPHDCPVCDEGGECHLQDMTVMTGHNYRRTRFPKKTFRNQDLGPFIHHEMNRCITCYRCVRFYQDYAGGTDLQAHASKDHVYFGRHSDGALENEFSGNLVEVCPTGVFTDRTLRHHYTRKWDLQNAPSVCPHCAQGCNTLPGERYGSLRRVLNRYHGQVNGYFLCDRGRFGYEYVNSSKRLRWPFRAQGSDRKLVPLARREDAIQQAASLLQQAQGVVGLGSPRASLEANYALRTLVGADAFHLGVSEQDAQLLRRTQSLMQQLPGRLATLNEVEQCDAVLVLGEDLLNTAPRLALAVRQAARQRAWQIADENKIPWWQDDAVRDAGGGHLSPLFLLTPGETRLEDIGQRIYHGAPADLARLGMALAHALDPNAPAVTDLTDEQNTQVTHMAETLAGAERPLIIAGVSAGNDNLLQAAANLVNALASQNDETRHAWVLPESNSLGLSLFEAEALDGALDKLQNGKADTLIVLENDLHRRLPPEQVQACIESAMQLIVLDSLATDTASAADLVLPTTTVAESTGTLVSSEARAQRYFRVYEPDDEIGDAWRWLRDVAAANGNDAVQDWQAVDDIIADYAGHMPSLAGAREAAPDATFRQHGLRVARESHRYSGRTSMHAAQTIHEPEPAEDPDAAMTFSMEGLHRNPPSALIPMYWSPGWNSVQASTQYQTAVGGPLQGGDPGVRLFDKSSQKPTAFNYFQQSPPRFIAERDQFLAVPIYHIFGSEELSQQAPAISQQTPAAYALLNEQDVVEHKLNAGEPVTVNVGGRSYELPLQTTPGLARGLIGLPLGLPEMTGVTLPATAQIKGGTRK